MCFDNSNVHAACNFQSALIISKQTAAIFAIDIDYWYLAGRRSTLTKEEKVIIIKALHDRNTTLKQL